MTNKTYTKENPATDEDIKRLMKALNRKVVSNLSNMKRRVRSGDISDMTDAGTLHLYDVHFMWAGENYENLSNALKSRGKT